MTNKTDAATPTLAHRVVSFWKDAGPDHWFSKNESFDKRFRETFFDAHFAAARQEFQDWLNQPESALALILLLDQYPRNAFRGTGHMFATDGLALACARKSLKFLDRVEPELRNFIGLPFVHSENLSVQDEALTLYRQHIPDQLRWTQIHHDIIARFGRFPHRNPALGRTTTAEERQFLDAGGFAG